LSSSRLTTSPVVAVALPNALLTLVPWPLARRLITLKSSPKSTESSCVTSATSTLISTCGTGPVELGDDLLDRVGEPAGDRDQQGVGVDVGDDEHLAGQLAGDPLAAAGEAAAEPAPAEPPRTPAEAPAEPAGRLGAAGAADAGAAGPAGAAAAEPRRRSWRGRRSAPPRALVVRLAVPPVVLPNRVFSTTSRLAAWALRSG
jgi:hypothetical protein